MRASRYPEAAFLAAMTASATHEVRNVLAIIKESAGLIEDLIQLSSERGTLDKEKVQRAVGRVDAQVKRGSDLLAGLNRLSHTLDQDLATVDLRQEVEQVVFRSKRFARKKNQTVMSREGLASATVSVHPLHLQMAFFAAMERCIEIYPEGTPISVGVENSDEIPEVVFSGALEGESQMPIPTEGAAWAVLKDLVESVGATVAVLGEGHGIKISFSSE